MIEFLLYLFVGEVPTYAYIPGFPGHCSCDVSSDDLQIAERWVGAVVIGARCDGPCGRRVVALRLEVFPSTADLTLPIGHLMGGIPSRSNS